MHEEEKKRILIVDDDNDSLELCSSLFASRQYQVLPFQSPQEALQTFPEMSANIALIDWELPHFNGGELAKRLLSINPDIQIIIFTAYSAPERVQESREIGVFDFISKPIDTHELLLKAEKAFERYNSIIEKRLLEVEMERLRDSLVGNSPVFVDALNNIFSAAKTKETILLQGETGTGKDLVAYAIHRRSPRNRHPFIPVNCPVLTESLLESELFGHEHDAFTGAKFTKKGYFEAAHLGTIFLDEIGELSEKVQSALLRVLDKGEIIRAGGTRPILVDVRVIAATNKNLAHAVQEGRFRLDLYHRLSVFCYTLPALNDRKEDIPILAEYFARSIGGKPLEISPDAKQMLMAHHYQGNVRELRNVITRAIAAAKGMTILPSHIDFGEDSMRLSHEQTKDILDQEWGPAKLKFEEQYLRYWLDKCKGNVGEMSRMIKRDRSDLYGRLKTFGLL